MRTREEVVSAFTPVVKLSEVQKTAILKLEIAFRDLATDIVDLVPETPDRTAALRKLLESKFTCTQAVTHYKPLPVQSAQAKEKEENAQKQKGR